MVQKHEIIWTCEAEVGFQISYNFIKEIKGLDNKLIKTVKEVDWATLKKNITSDEEGNVMLKDTGECIESLSARKTLPSIKIETAWWTHIIR